MRLGEAILFFALAAGVHAGLWHMAPHSTGTMASGEGGTDVMTVAAASPAQAAMVARWQQPPEVSSATTTMRPTGAAPSQIPLASAPAPTPMDRPALPRAETASRLAALSVKSALPQVDATPAAAPPRAEPAPKVRPKLRPDPAPRIAATGASSAQAERRAAGQGSAVRQGSGKDLTQSANSGRSNALRAKWGAQIHAKVQRNMRYPRGATGSGTAKLALKVAPNGKLKRLSVLRSSGNAMLDKAAIRAVQRAGRFAKAPEELTESLYAFSLSLTFTR